MRKVFFLLFLLIMGSLDCFAQDENRFGEMLHNGMYWKYREYSGYEDGEIIGSKTINDKVYGILRIHRGFYDEARASEFDEYYNWTTATVAIRDEGGRIYVNKDDYLNLMSDEHYWLSVGQSEPLPYETTEEGDLILYDFTKNVGDVYCKMPDGSDLTVTKVDILKTEDSVSRRRLTLSNGYDLIEGVGCTNSVGFFMFWLNATESYREKMRDMGLLTIFGYKDNNGKRNHLLVRDFDATLKELEGHPNKMLTQGRRWIYDYDNGDIKGKLTYTIDGDTLIHGYKRAKLNMELVDIQTRNVVRSGYAGAFNENNDWLCYLAPNASDDIELYYFNWKCGSYIFNKWRDNIRRFVVNSDDIQVGEETFRRLQLANMNDQYLPREKDSLYYWIEGIGSSKGLLDNIAGGLMDSIRFNACYDGEKCIFTRENFLKENTYPYAFSTRIVEDSLFYDLDMSTRTAKLAGKNFNQPFANVVIPSSIELWGVDCDVVGITDYAFYNCTNLKSITLPESIVSIGEYAFRKSGLTEVVIPDNVKSIGASAFAECSGLVSVSLPRNLSLIRMNTFWNCTGLQSVTFPEDLETIGTFAFAKCTSLKKVDLPATLTILESGAFKFCENLMDIYCRAMTPPNADALGVFKNISPEATLHVPNDALLAYKNANKWAEFKYIVPIEEDTDVIMVQKSEPDTHLLFDLQGRPVKDASKHGIYVKDGRKVIW